jgi:hypothetical protein
MQKPLYYNLVYLVNFFFYPFSAKVVAIGLPADAYTNICFRPRWQTLFFGVAFVFVLAHSLRRLSLYI